MAHIGRIRPTEIRMVARTMPKGIHRRIRRAVGGVGRLTRRPSWKITGSGRRSWWSWWWLVVLFVNGGWDSSYNKKAQVLGSG